MSWKRGKIFLSILVGLIVLIPIILYISAIDLSKSYSTGVADLPLHDGSQEEGIFRLEANEMEFKTHVRGLQNTGNNIIFLHGFPQTSKIWEPIMEEAAEEGYRVVAFDQRGYSPGARPTGKEHYDIQFLVADLLAVADAVGFEKFHLVGHDWGASVGWKTVMDHPSRVLTWTALSIPHIGVFQEALQSHPEQQKRSSYIAKLQKPILPEFLFVLARDKMMDNVRGVWREEEIEEVNALLGEHGALTAALNWYRAADITTKSVDQLKKKIVRPTLYIWGNQDQVLAPEIIPLQNKWLTAFYKEVELDAGHSLVQEKRDTVMSLFLEHWQREQ